MSEYVSEEPPRWFDWLLGAVATVCAWIFLSKLIPVTTDSMGGVTAYLLLHVGVLGAWWILLLKLFRYGGGQPLIFVLSANVAWWGVSWLVTLPNRLVYLGIHVLAALLAGYAAVSLCGKRNVVVVAPPLFMALTLVVANVAYPPIRTWYQEGRRDTEANKARMRAVAGLQPRCRTAPPSQSVPRRAKVLVWDMNSNQKSDIHDLLPGQLKIHHRDRRASVVMVLGTRDEQVGTYSISGQPAYRVHVDVCLVDWPERRIRGRADVIGFDPVSVRQVQGNPEYGDINQAVADWISDLSRPSK